jgi:hypothetical protein
VEASAGLVFSLAGMGVLLKTGWLEREGATRRHYRQRVHERQLPLLDWDVGKPWTIDW